MTRPAPSQPGRQPYPWVVPDLFRWFALLGLSLVGTAVAWWCASGTATFNSQLTWLNVGVAAVIVGGLGNMTWLLQGRRALALRRRDVMAAVEAMSSTTPSVAVVDDDVRLTVPGTTRYHRASCAAIAGKKAKAMSVAKHERAGRRPCGLCGG